MRRDAHSDPDCLTAYIYIDEFPRVATPDFAKAFTQFRKRKVSVTVALQFMSQMVKYNVNTGCQDHQLRDAIYENVGSFVFFRTGSRDAQEIASLLDIDIHQVKKIGRYKALARFLHDNEIGTPSIISIPLAPQPVGNGNADLIVQRMINEGYWLPRKDIETTAELEAPADKSRQHQNDVDSDKIHDLLMSRISVGHGKSSGRPFVSKQELEMATAKLHTDDLQTKKTATPSWSDPSFLEKWCRNKELAELMFVLEQIAEQKEEQEKKTQPKRRARKKSELS
jgi:hypothetical protein